MGTRSLNPMDLKMVNTFDVGHYDLMIVNT